MCLKCPIASEQLRVFSHCQTFPLTSTITDVNLECGTWPEWRNSERELLTFVQSHDGRERPGQPQENKLYLQQKKTFLFVFHFASTCIKQTSKQTRLMNTEISNKKSLPRDSSEEQQQQEGLIIVHTVEKHPDGAKVSSWSSSDRLCLTSGSLFESESCARWKPASKQKITGLPIHLRVSVWKLEWFSLGEKKSLRLTLHF